jgi:hypothetical protein
VDIPSNEIPAGQWRAYFDHLSVQFQGWRITAEVLSNEVGDQPIVEDLTLQGISFESKGSEAGAILIEAGDTPGEYMVHHVHAPCTVRFAATMPGREADILIDCEDGAATLIRLRPRAELPGRQVNARGRPRS